MTREGKKLTYLLHVMQQPQRARACGAGAKSSADRRPVDPPPVVEMLIFESDPHDPEKPAVDVTFAYNANFFLYATLENARPMAQGRIAQPPSAAVLTGVPVAGVAYLDRPLPAGYFIFPDLSVRHEGLYRLCFHLYEQTKESKDESEGTIPRPTPAPGKIGAPHQFLDFRLEVFSDPFTVYSAKKFPGLNQSTPLSRAIADQGCRVRIRREVRMRRREEKPTDNYDCGDDRGYNGRRAEAFPRPDAYGNAPERHRSASISTVDPYAYPSQRRPSAQDYPPTNPQHYQRPVPHTPVQSTTPIPQPIMIPGPLAVASSTPSPASAHPPSMPAQPPLHTPSYQASQPSHLAFNTTQTQYPAPPPSFTQPTVVPTNLYSPRPRNPSIGNEYDSIRYGPSHPRPPMERQSYAQPQPPTPMTPLPPIRTLDTQPTEGHPPLEPLSHPRSRTPSATSLPPIRYPDFGSALSQPSSSIGSSPAAALDHGSGKGGWETTQTLSKRTYEESFGHDERPLRNGMRPDSDSYPGSLQRRPSYERHSFFDNDDAMIYKRASGRQVAVTCYSRLQNSLLSSCRSPDTYSNSYGSRPSYSFRGGHGYGYGYEWEASGSRSSCESDFLSEVSGQFDDAEESEYYSYPGNPGDEVRYYSSTHSVKRRRSNDWPRDTNHNDSAGHSRSVSGSGTWQRWPFGHHRRHGSAHGSPRSQRHVRPGRRSRFVEGHMNDTVSTKPPSIFFPDEARTGTANGIDATTAATARVTHRNSGIFRFGKAIASAFNPFGGWGSVSDIWRSSQVQTPEPEPATNDRLKQAQLAYEELKKSGYQGTNKGSYMASMGATRVPDETWKAIQEKMQYGSNSAVGSSSATAAAQHSRQSSGSSLRPSFPDLRKAKSSLGVSSKKQDGQEVRHQKSRKDMQKQAKLLKRVSNLEDKLERARRELREFSASAEEEPLPRSSLNEQTNGERPYQRKFVPGALPSLPSERLLHGPHPKTTTPLSSLVNPTLQAQAQAQAPNHEPATQTQTDPEVRVYKARQKSPRPWRKPSGPRSLSAHSPSRKRKSPDPGSRRKPDSSESDRPPPVPPLHNHQQQPEQPQNNNQGIQPESSILTVPNCEPQALEPQPEPEPESQTRTPSRRPKLPKTARCDSPGSVERKQRRSSAAEGSTSLGEERAGRGRPLRSTNRNRSATPVLRMKRGRGDLRSTTSPADRPRFDEDKENQIHDQSVKADEIDAGKGNWSTVDDPTGEPEAFTEPPSPSVTPSRRKARYEYIPPVPPLPKDLAATAAKVDRRLAKEMGKRKVQRDRDITGIALTGDDAVPGLEGKVGAGTGPGFQWPEDIF
ncbi:sexual development activator VeA [Aspergillus stella-maris]|uniref:sexual development activator VeA n=1 Tax=Aspergillus stella-maris TaxID=1810926 RepID=UPI003CCE4E95